MLFKTFVGSAALLFALSAQATCPTTLTAYRYRLNGAEVTDFKTGLVWARCTLGQTLSGGACVGTPQLMSHEQALMAAGAANGWRLPNAKELFSIVDQGCKGAMAVDPAAFPNLNIATMDTPTWIWSSTRSGSDDSAIVVFFGGVGSVTTIERSRANLGVRLVRDDP